MPELCEQFCPAYRECRERLSAVISYSGNLSSFRQELETAARDRGRDLRADACLPPELLEDIRTNSAKYTRLWHSLRQLRSIQQQCDGPAPSRRGLLIMRDTLIRQNTDEATRQRHIYSDADCGNPVGRTILANLPKI